MGAPWACLWNLSWVKAPDVPGGGGMQGGAWPGSRLDCAVERRGRALGRGVLEPTPGARPPTKGGDGH